MPRSVATPVRPGRHRPSQRGAGLLSSVAGITVFLGFLFFAVQLLYNLYATSVVTANAYDAARQVASSEVDHGDAGSVSEARRSAEAEARARMGRYQSRVDAFEWDRSTPAAVRLRVRAHNPDLLLLGGLLGFDDIDRTVVVRTERFQP
ncbi:MAG: hypothetical protein WKF43_10510 [Acidimicrobiales bacterium]